MFLLSLEPARRLAGLLLLIVAAPVLFAQSALKPDPEDKSKAASYYLRMRDEVRAKEAVEHARTLLHTAAFRDALHDSASALPHLFVTADRFVTATGITFDAFQLGLPHGVMRGGAKVILFGEITDAAGKVVASIEEPAVVSESKNDRFVECVLFLPVAKASTAFGVAAGGEVIAVGRASFDADEMIATSPGVSRLLVSNNIFNLTQMQSPFTPFAFGGTKVIAKPDRSFQRTDELWLFEEIRSPKTDIDGSPRLTMRITIERDGKTVANTTLPAEASPLKGVAGHFGIGTTVDLSALRPGDYNVHLTVIDELAKKSYEQSQSITILD
jgi:hypothetical protein